MGVLTLGEIRKTERGCKMSSLLCVIHVAKKWRPHKTEAMRKKRRTISNDATYKTVPMVLSIFFMSMCHRSISEAMKLLVRWYCAKYLWWCLWVYINLLRWFRPCRDGRKDRNERILQTRGWNCFIIPGNPGTSPHEGFWLIWETLKLVSATQL